MNFHLNYWKDQVMAEGDHPPVGRLLCTDKDQTKVEPSGAKRSGDRLAISRTQPTRQTDCLRGSPQG